MFRPLISTVLFWRLHGHVGGGAVFNALGNAEVLLQDDIVTEMAVSVTSGASVSGSQIDIMCDRSRQATFPTFSATGVREVTVSVTFGAPHSVRPVAPTRRQFVDNIAGTEHGGGFSTNATLIS